MSLLPSFGMLITSGAMAIVTSIVGIIQAKKDFKKELKERMNQYNAYIEKKKGLH